MKNYFVNIVSENTKNQLIDINKINIDRLKVGFVPDTCDYIKTLLSVMCVHALENSLIFTDERLNNINDLINKLSYES